MAWNSTQWYDDNKGQNNNQIKFGVYYKKTDLAQNYAWNYRICVLRTALPTAQRKVTRNIRVYFFRTLKSRLRLKRQTPKTYQLVGRAMPEGRTLERSVEPRARSC